MAETSDELLQRVLRSAASLSQQQAARLTEEVRQQVEREVRDWLHSAWKAALLRQLADELQQCHPDLAANARQEAAHDADPRDEASPEAVTQEDAVEGEVARDENAGADSEREKLTRAAARPEETAPRREQPAAPSAANPAARSGAQTIAQPDPNAADNHLGQYAYGIVLADHPSLPSDLAGVDSGFAVQMLGHEGLQVITSCVSLRDFSSEGWTERVSDLEWVEARLRVHDQVLKTALAQGPLIPLRFGTVFRCEEDLVRLLSADHDRLAKTLHRLSGKAEWGVKIRGCENRGDRAAPRGHRTGVAASADGHGRAYLQQKQRERQQQRASREQRAAVARRCHGALADAACEAIALPAAPAAAPRSRDEALVLNGSYLLDRSQVESFCELVMRLARQHSPSGLKFETTGPWPPYHFVDLEVFLDHSQ